MKITALRNVCAGVDKNLKPGQVADVEDEDAQFLISIGAAAEGTVDVAAASSAASTDVAA